MLSKPTCSTACLAAASLSALISCSSVIAQQNSVHVYRPSSIASTGGYYFPNKTPLAPTQFIRLPIGSITPGGWLRKQLELDSSGIVGQMPVLSDYLKYEGNGWVDPNGKAGWEELTYWLRGYGDLGYVLGDQKIINVAKHWLDGVIKSQREDGWFGPDAARTSLDGGPDLWPHMPLLCALRSYEEFTHDTRVIPFLLKFCRFQDSMPAEVYKRGWGAVRWGDNLDTVYWLYNRTGEKWLLTLAEKMHKHSADYTGGIPTWHNVNLSQGIREPAEFWQQSHDPINLRATYRDYDTIMGRFGQFPGGGFAGDENCRPGFADPRQGFETCGWVEYMHTFEMMARISSDPLWADRCEDIAFNSYPASLDPLHRGTHYITSANSIDLSMEGKHESQFANGDMPMQAYMPGIHNYRCCPHNLGMGWPYYAEELWLATADEGLCASLYARSSVTAKVRGGVNATISEETDYPFSDQLYFHIVVPRETRFPLYLRVPQWCASPSIQVNGKNVAVHADPLTFIVIERNWKSGDRVTLNLPMKVSVRTWTHNHNSVSIDYGPLNFSADIKEQWKSVQGPDAWPAFEVHAQSPWNYGIALNGSNGLSEVQVVKSAAPVPNMPFVQSASPITIKVKARRIPQWQADADGVVGLLQQSPARSTEALETITLVPSGGARLRITAFPTVSTGEQASVWHNPNFEWPKIKASFVHDSLKSVLQEVTPSSSYDITIPRFTWWDHRGTAEWIQQDFEKPQAVSQVSVYWFDDTGHGQCRIPQSWRLLYRDGATWKEVVRLLDAGVARDKYDTATFAPVKTDALRIEVQLQPEFSGGVLSWQVK